MSVTSNLVVRSAPEVSDQSQIYDVRLGPGDLLWVEEGPVEGSGYWWYRGQVPSPQTPDGWRTGWVAAADKDGTPWLARVEPEGELWRLLGEGTEGIAYTVAVAADQAALEQVWEEAGADGNPPEVSFEDEVVVRYTHAVSGSCPEIMFRGVGLDERERIVYTVATSPIDSPDYDGPGCTTDARPHAFIVAVDRGRLPSGEVHFRLERGFIACPDCGRESEQVTITLP